VKRRKAKLSYSEWEQRLADYVASEVVKAYDAGYGQGRLDAAEAIEALVLGVDVLSAEDIRHLAVDAARPDC
jgi:hypothetical protein